MLMSCFHVPEPAFLPPLRTKWMAKGEGGRGGGRGGKSWHSIGKEEEVMRCASLHEHREVQAEWLGKHRNRDRYVFSCHLGVLLPSAVHMIPNYIDRLLQTISIDFCIN